MVCSDVIRDVRDLVEEHIVQTLNGLFPALNALQLIQTFCRLIAQQQGGKGADAHFEMMLRRFLGLGAFAVFELHREGAVVPWEELVLDLQRDGQGATVRVAGIIGEEVFHVDDAAHGIGADALFDVAIVHLKGDGFAEIGAAVHLVDHGIVSVDVLPQAFLRLAVQIDHFLDVHDVVLDEVDHVAAGLVLDVVIDGHIGVVLVPAPVFLPREAVAEQAPMGDGRKVGVQLMELGVVPGDAADVAGRFDLGGDLPVLDVERDLVGDDLPPQMMVQRDGIRVEQREGFALLVHLGQALDHQLFHDALPGVLRVGADAGDKADMVHRIVDVHLQRVDRKLRDEVFAIEAAQHIGALQHRELGLLDLIVLPAGGGQFLFRDLKSIPQQRVVLVQILRFEVAGGIMFCGVHDNAPSSRSQTVGAAEQELGFLDGQAAEQHGQAVDAQTEAAVRRAAILEELQIELDVLGQTLFLGLLLQHLIAVLALCAGGDLDTAPDQVVALGHTVLVAHVVERALLGSVIGDEQELVAIVLLDPLIAQALGLGGQVALFRVIDGVAELLFQTLVQVGQLDHGERRLRDDDLLTEGFLDLLAVCFLDGGKASLQQFFLHLHDIAEGGDVAELQIEAGELGGVLVGVALLSTEDGAGLKDALEPGSHGHLLVELGALRQVGVAVKVIDLEHLGAALAGRSDQLGGVDLNKVLVQQELAHGVDHAALGLEHQLVLIGAQIDPAVINALVDAGALDGLLLFGRGDLLADDGQCVRNALDLDGSGDHLDAAHLDVIVLHHLAGDGDDGIRGQLVDGVHQFGVVGLLDGDLELAGNIFQHDKGHGLAVAQVLDKALDFDRIANFLLYLVDVGAVHGNPPSYSCVLFYYSLFVGEIKAIID